MNSINWIIDTQITEKRSVYFARLRGLVGKMVLQCFDVNGKKPRWPEIRLTFYLLSAQERNMYEGQGYKHDFYLGKLLLSRGSLRLPHVWVQYTTPTQGILVHRLQTFSLHSFLFPASLSGRKRHRTLYRCSTPLPTSPNDTEGINGMVSDYWNIYCEVEIIYSWYQLLYVFVTVVSTDNKSKSATTPTSMDSTSQQPGEWSTVHMVHVCSCNNTLMCVCVHMCGFIEEYVGELLYTSSWLGYSNSLYTLYYTE